MAVMDSRTAQESDVSWEMDEARRLMRMCSCGTKEPPQLRYDPGVTYITCVCSPDARVALPDWNPRLAVRRWNDHAYFTHTKFKKGR
jgi:hypothetical protein